MRFILYRSTLSLTSGAGQLIRVQAEALRAAGEDVLVACRRGWLKFRLRTGLPVSRSSPTRSLLRAARAGDCLVDHGMELRSAKLVFVHNLMTEAVRRLPREDWRRRAEQEREFLAALSADTRIVANSRLVEQALISHFGLAPERVRVLYPGIDVGRFSATEDPAAGVTVRRMLGIDPSAPVVGFVTSGDFEKRGLDMFVAAAERIAGARSDVRFVVVGSRRLPDWAARHPLVRRRQLIHRPKGLRPERWFPALDVFLYAARFEEFGMVVGEAMAAGRPVLTSRQVGAAECLPAEYAPWLLDVPDAARFAEKALALLDDADARARLAEAGVAAARAFDQALYARASLGEMREAATAC